VSALNAECEKVRSAQHGTRNATLNMAAYSIGQLVAGREVDRSEAEARLADAAEDAGLEQDETQKTITNGITAGCQQPRTSGPVWAETYESGKPRRSLRNAIIAIQALPLTCQHDTFHMRKTVGGQLIGRHAGEITDDAIAALRLIIIEKFGFDPGKEHLIDAVNTLCIENPFDPIISWLDGLHWDEVSRLEKWLIAYGGAEDTPLNRAIGILMLVAMVRRARVPGCKFDLMIVLEGQQGCGKSTLLLVLAGDADNFTDTPLLHLDAKGVAEAVSGKWLVEIPELSGLGKRDVEDTKALLSRTDDRARPAYGRYVESHPRRCIFVGTTNADEYLQDDTGNRRFAPVGVGKIDIEGIRRDRDQLFAEAAHLERKWGELTLPPAVWGDAAATTDERRVVDPWAQILSERLNPARGHTQGYLTRPETLTDGTRRITSVNVATSLGLDPKDCTPATHRRITSAMRSLGWEPARWYPQDQSYKVRGFIKK
jgi:hypothetical protein